MHKDVNHRWQIPIPRYFITYAGEPIYVETKASAALARIEGRESDPYWRIICKLPDRTYQVWPSAVVDGRSAVVDGGGEGAGVAPGSAPTPRGTPPLPAAS